MQKSLFILLFSGICFLVPAQSKTTADKNGVCKVKKVSPDATPKSKITFRFVGPTGKPAASRLTFRVDETMVDPQTIDKKTGIYVMTVEPGAHKFTFFVPYWKDVNSEAITFKSKTNTEIFVKFVPEEYGGSK
jgi:hypothetical protein